MSNLYDLEFDCSKNPAIIIHAAEWLQAYEAQTGEPVWTDPIYLWDNALRIWMYFRHDEFFGGHGVVGTLPLWDSMEVIGWVPCDQVKWLAPSPTAPIADLTRSCAANPNLMAQAVRWLSDYEAACGEPVWSKTAYLLYWIDRLWLHFRQAEVAIGAPDPGPLPLWNAMEASGWVACQDVGKPPPSRYNCVSGKCVVAANGIYQPVGELDMDWHIEAQFMSKNLGGDLSPCRQSGFPHLRYHHVYHITWNKTDGEKDY